MNVLDEPKWIELLWKLVGLNFGRGRHFGVNFCHACQRVTNKISGEQAGRAFHANSFLWNLPQRTSGDEKTHNPTSRCLNGGMPKRRSYVQTKESVRGFWDHRNKLKRVSCFRVPAPFFELKFDSRSISPSNALAIHHAKATIKQQDRFKRRPFLSVAYRNICYRVYWMARPVSGGSERNPSDRSHRNK